MDIAARIRRARFVRILCAVVGALASLIAVADFARTHADIALFVGILVAIAVLVRFRRELADFLRRYRRDILFLLLGASIGGAGTFAWSSRASPDRAPPKLASESTAPAPAPDLETTAPSPTPSTSSEIVYRTPSGKRYHRATCGHVKGKEIALSLAEAKEQGLTPCKVCNPPP